MCLPSIGLVVIATSWRSVLRPRVLPSPFSLFPSPFSLLPSPYNPRAMDDRTFENLLIDRVGTDDRVGRITLNRPEKMNSLSQELLFELNDALHDLEADDDVRVIIVRGAG